MGTIIGALLFIAFVIGFIRIEQNTIVTRKKVEEIEALLKADNSKSKKE